MGSRRASSLAVLAIAAAVVVMAVALWPEPGGGITPYQTARERLRPVEWAVALLVFGALVERWWSRRH